MLTVSKAVTINAAPDRIWDALTESSEVAQALLGARIESDWQRGGAIAYVDAKNGQALPERGTIVDIDAPLLLRVSYTTSAGGTSTLRGTITHALSRDGKATRLTVTQSFAGTPEEAARAEANWTAWLEATKLVIEG